MALILRLFMRSSKSGGEGPRGTHRQCANIEARTKRRADSTRVTFRGLANLIGVKPPAFGAAFPA